MCQLLGLAFNQQVAAAFSFRGFRQRASANPDGWGLAAFPDESAQIFKEPLPANESALSEFVREYEQLSSKIFVGHVRYGNVGGVKLANTHPFLREVRGHDLVFAHNGTLKQDELRRCLNGRFTPVGKTDSELALCAFLTWMVNEEIPFEAFHEIEDHLREMNEQGKMNLLFSDGVHLFAYHDYKGYNGLVFVRREAPFAVVSLKDEDWQVDLAQEKRPDQHGYVIATKALTDEEWQCVGEGTLRVFKDGTMIYPK